MGARIFIISSWLLYDFFRPLRIRSNMEEVYHARNVLHDSGPWVSLGRFGRRSGADARYSPRSEEPPSALPTLRAADLVDARTGNRGSRRGTDCTSLVRGWLGGGGAAVQAQTPDNP